MRLSLISSSHRSLDSEKLFINYSQIMNPTYFMQSNFKLSRLFLGKKKYNISVNPLIFEQDIPAAALKGVLAHELFHTEDYNSGSTVSAIIPTGLKYLLQRTQFERKTDLRVIQKGLAQELKDYKLWQYQLLSAEALDKKKQEYLSPIEIDFILDITHENPEYLDDWLKFEIPESLTIKCY